MQYTTAALALIASFAPLINAHYTFSQLLVNGYPVGSDWQYIREHTRGYMPTKSDELMSNDFRCNTGAGSGANTEVYTVKPGDKVGMKQAFGADGIEHPGPAQVYMSLAPSSVKSYDGSGDWFKVQQDILCTAGNAEALKTNAWCIWGKNNIEFTVPSTIPDGEYLVRSEHIAIHGAHDHQAEFYYSCAQLKVQGGSGSSVPAGVKIPGVYSAEDPAINFSVWGSATTYPDLPGPEVASGGRTTGSIDGTSTGTTIARRAVEGGSPAARAAAQVNA